MKSTRWLLAALLAASIPTLAQNAAVDIPPTIDTQVGPLQKSLPLTRNELLTYARQIAGADKSLIPAQIDTLAALVRLRGVVSASTPESEAEIKGILGDAKGKSFDLLEQIRTNTGGPRPAKNETVEVRRGGKTRPAKVAEVTEKGYTIEFLDAAPIDVGQQETVAPSLVWRIIPGEQLTALLTTGVPIQIQGTDAATKALRWFDGEIVGVEAAGYKVRVAGGAAEATVRPRFLRRAVAVSPDKNAAGAGDGNIATIAMAFKKGQWVEIYWGGKWWKGRILAVDDVAGKYKVHYDGWGDNWDEWVTPEKVR